VSAPSLDDAIRRIVREELDARAKEPDASEWLPHTKWPVKSPRVACALARSGAIPAHRSGRTWIARRADIDAWVLAQPVATPPELETSEPSNDFEPIEASRRAAMRMRSA